VFLINLDDKERPASVVSSVNNCAIKKNKQQVKNDHTNQQLARWRSVFTLPEKKLETQLIKQV